MIPEIRSDLEKLFAGSVPDVFIVCGSGFKAAAEDFESVHILPMQKRGHQSVEGHGNALRICKYGDQTLCFQTGRWHIYQGYSAQEVAAYVFAAAELGVKNFILTNAAGGLNDKLSPGEIIVLKDFINLSFENCLIGTEYATRFVDMKDAFCKDWRENIRTKQALKEGIYCGLKGPTFETAAETRFLSLIGADVVGMSTVQEIIAARTFKRRILGLSFVSNLCGDLNTSGSSHQEVLEAGDHYKSEMKKVLKIAINTCP